MLAEKCLNPEALRYPVLATPKIDGVRTLIHPELGPISRSWKSVPNDYIREALRSLPPGLDGEILIPGLEFKDISGAWRAKDGDWPNFRFYVFDYVQDFDSEMRHLPYVRRINMLEDMDGLPDFVHKLLPITINTHDELLQATHRWLAEGYHGFPTEGSMIRSPEGPYKEGRATNREGYLLKIKDMEDSEAEILGMEELQHNDNPAEEDAFGRTKRSSHKANLRPGGVMGKLNVRDIYDGREFRIGTGFDAADRAWFWEHQDEVIGKIVNYTYQKVGTADKPRIPVYHGLRGDL